MKQILATVLALSMTAGWQSALAQQGEYPRVVVDPARDIQTTIDGDFTIAAVGDVVAIRPTANLDVGEVQAIYDVIREADVAFGNLEFTIADPAVVNDYNDAHLFQALARPAIADDLRAIGFDLMNFANNHTTHFGVIGMRETMQHMDRVGIVTAGWGERLAEASGARYLDTPKGRIGFLGITTNARSDARPAGAESPGVPGANALHAQRVVTVSRESLEAIRRAYESSPQMFPSTFPITSSRAYRDNGDNIRIYDQVYVAGDHAHFSYTVPEDEMRSYAREVRNAKYMSDFVVANIHTHHWQIPEEPRNAGDESRTPPDFLVELAHTAIDNGADAFYSHGEGELRGIEIYKGRPIFYQLGNFTRQPFFHEIHNPEFRQMAASRGAGDTSDLTNAEIQAWIYPANHSREYFESVAAVSRFDEGVLREIRLYPIDLRFDGPFVDIGTPHLASGEVAQRVLNRLREESETLGTEVRITGDVGVIRLPRN